MKKLRAFVAHSFTQEDEQLIGKFLKYLDAIQELHSNFSWHHAERPEPSAIDDKVLRIFEDKNVFIGICTRKEFVLQPSCLSTIPLLFDRKVVRSNEFVWKTSDWIIQEIGLACGRGLHVILLVEEGVRSPGGIQGTLEYIPFSRDLPEKSFGKLLQMIASLSEGKSENIETTEEAIASAEVESDSEKSPNWLVPDHTWDRRKYEIAYMHHMVTDDADGAAEISRAFSDSVIGSHPNETDSWSAFCEYIRILFGRGGSIERVVALVCQHPENPAIHRYLARSYKELGEVQKAVGAFVAASGVAQSSKQKIELLAEAVQVSAEKHPKIAEGLLAEAKEISHGDAELESSILTIENEFSKARNETGFMFASLERLLEDHPDDHTRRFDLAYAYSEAGMTDMALYHYLRIPNNDRTDATWNNLGVAYENQKLSAKSISAYKQSLEIGGTLAASNLAYRLISAGFLDEAREIIEVAAKTADHHKNVDSAMVKLKETPEKEAEEEKKIVSSAQDVSGFYRKMGAALAVVDIEQIQGRWKFDGFEVDVSIENGVFSAFGFKEEPPALRRLYAADAKPAIIDLKISGKVRGRAIHGTCEKKRRGETTILGMLSSDNKEEVLLFISEEQGSIEVLRGSGEKRRMESMTRLTQSPPEKIIATA